MTQADNDNLPAIVAVITGAVFVAVSVTIAMTVSVEPDRANASESEASSTFSVLNSLAPNIVPENQEQKDDGGDANTEVGNCDPQIFAKNLQPGDQGPQVKALQGFLNKRQDTQLAESGPGSPGRETGNYGQLTERAVERFQNTYLGSVSKVEGVWGLQSRMQARQLCENPQLRAQTKERNENPTTNIEQADKQDENEQHDPGSSKQNDQSDSGKDNQQDTKTSDESSSTSQETTRDFEDYRELKQRVADDDTDFQNRLQSEDTLFGGEAQLSDFTVWGAGRIREGETDDVVGMSFDVEKSDVLIKRVDVSFVHTGQGDDEPWDVIESVQLRSDNSIIASVDASEDNWTDDGSDYTGELDGDEKFTIRLDDFDEVIDRGDSADLSVHVTTKDSVDDAGEASWGVFVDDEGVRLVDAVGVQKRIGDDSQVKEFVIDEGYDWDDPELRTEIAYNNPESSVISANPYGFSGPFNIFSFNIDARDTNVRLEKITLQVAIKGYRDNSEESAAYDDVIDEAAITISDDVFTVDKVKIIPQRGEITRAELTFTPDKAVVVEEYGDEAVSLLVRLKGVQNNYREGLLLRGTVGEAGVVSEDLKSEGGTAGNWHILRAR